jgi:hypothetical protein
VRKHFIAQLSMSMLLLMAPSLALAQSEDDKSTARALANEGADAFDKQDFKTAADRFRRAVAIFDDAKAASVPPTLLLGLARSDAKMGRYVAATETYNRIVRQGTAAGAAQVFVDAVTDARREIEPLLPKIANVTITVTGCDNPRVTVDDVPISAAAIGVKKPVDPGPHIVKATALGCEPGQTSFTVEETKSADASIALVQSPTPPPAPGDARTAEGGSAEHLDSSRSSLRTYAYVAFGVGAVGLVAGAITGGLALGKHSALNDECTDGVCRSTTAKSDLDGFHTMTSISTVGFIVAGVGAAAGTALFFMAPRSSATKSAWIAPTIGLGSVGAVGRF